MKHLRYVSLFSGAGGLDSGLLRTKVLRPALATDWDSACISTLNAALAMHEADIWQGDIHDVLNSGMLKCYKDITIVAGGPPCQGFSVAGYMDPEDERSQLVFRFMDAVEQIRPVAFIMENVPALAGERWKYVMRALRATGRKLGYQTYVFVLDAADYGVPQDRKRMFFIGMPPGCKPVIPKGTEKISAGKALKERFWEYHEIQCNARITLAKNPVLRRSPYAGFLLNGQGRVIDLEKRSPVLPATMGGNKTPIIDLMQKERGTKPWIEEYHAHLMAGGKPLAEIPKGVFMRRLSLCQAACLQGFDGGYPFAGKPAERWRMVGNAVPPRLGQAAALAVLAGLGELAVA